jgi:hypothetical protein
VFRIRDVSPGSVFFPSRILDRIFSIPDPGSVSGSFITDPDPGSVPGIFYSSRILGSMGQKGTGSRIRTRNTDNI